MQPSRLRFSHRHLLALCTFLVPLGVLAVLGQSELKRSGAEAQEALVGAAREFLRSAKRAVDRRFKEFLPPLLEESQDHLAKLGPVRTTLALRQKTLFAPLRDIILLNDRGDAVWPNPAPATMSLPLLPDRRSQDNPIYGAIDAAELLWLDKKPREAIDLLNKFVAQIEAAKPPREAPNAPMQGTRRLRELEAEVHARFRLATTLHALGETAAARTEFEKTAQIVNGWNSNRTRLDYSSRAIGLVAEGMQAELGTPADRLKLLRVIAEGDRWWLSDDLLSTVARRLAAKIAPEDDERHDAEVLLAEERQREATRTFAADYDLGLRLDLCLRRYRQPNPNERPANTDERLITSLGRTSSLLSVRRATDDEKILDRRCSDVALHIDLGQMLAPVLHSFDGTTGTDSDFVLAVFDPGDFAIVPPPNEMPVNFDPPSIETNGLTLLAYPADAPKLIAEAEGAAQTRTLLVLALFVTALGGALWSWRSVSREAELAALKINLVSRVSHELKTPLALIRMYGETLGMGRARDSEQAQHFGGIISRESERLTTLIQRILDFSRQQAGTLQYSPQTVDLGSLLRKVCDAYTPHLEARGAILVETLPPDILAHCDASAFESAIVNLLENAAKYAVEGDHEQEIELDLTTADDMVVLEVRDRGRGIPPAELDRVFEGFYRASNAGEVRGAGLGLSLVHHFARAHGGNITAHARTGGGTIFRITLPKANAPDRTAAPARAAVAGSLPEGNPT